MTMDTYNAIMALQDQFITQRGSSMGWRIAILANNKEIIDSVVQLARSGNAKVKKNLVGKGTPDAEMHLIIN